MNLIKLFKKKPPSIQEAILLSIESQKTEKVVVDRKALEYLIKRATEADTDRKNIEYLVSIFQQGIDASRTGKELITELQTLPPNQNKILFLAQNSQKVSIIWDFIKVFFKANTHITQILKLIKEYAIQK